MEILYQDEALLVINKPAGLSTLPDGYDPSLPHVKNMLEQNMGRLWVVHRLDKGTSGVLILARNAEAHKSLNTQFEKHTVAKEYHAVVEGSPNWDEQTIQLPLLVNGDRQHRTIVDLQAGKSAVTHLNTLERFQGYCLVRAIPETGRTHQIRAHLSALGFPIVGDKLYRRVISRDAEIYYPPGPHKDDVLLVLAGSLALHARSLEVSHPFSGEKLKFTAAYPQAFLDLLQFLRSMKMGE